MGMQHHIDAVFSGGLSTPATYTATGIDTEIRAIYQRDAELLSGNAVIRADRVKVRRSEVAAPKRGDTITINGETRKVAEVSGGGAYIWELMLR